jgi:hypothetical protein
MKRLVILALVLAAFALAGKTTHLIKVTKADGTTERFWVETITKITFKADKNDSAGLSIPMSRIVPVASASWNSHTSSLSVIVPEGRASVRFFDALGNCVYRNATLVKGENVVKPGLKCGVYVVHVQTGAYHKTLNLNVKQ